MSEISEFLKECKEIMTESPDKIQLDISLELFDKQAKIYHFLREINTREGNIVESDFVKYLLISGLARELEKINIPDNIELESTMDSESINIIYKQFKNQVVQHNSNILNTTLGVDVINVFVMDELTKNSLPLDFNGVKLNIYVIGV